MQGRTHDFDCPVCGSVIPLDNFRLTRAFPCPSCHTELDTPPIYGATVVVLSFVLPLTAAYYVGARGLALASIAAVTAFPTSMILMKIARTCLRPPLRPTSTDER